MRGRGRKAEGNIGVRGRGHKAEGISAGGGAAVRPKDIALRGRGRKAEGISP
jgi:hypothetical protein